jgi:hypothetical protein
MPYSVESLCNVKKDSRAHAFVFMSFYSDVSDTMYLVFCRVKHATKCLSAMICVKRLSISFSNKFDMNGSNEIGRYDSTSLRFLPGFGIIITSAVFHASRIQYTIHKH